MPVQLFQGAKVTVAAEKRYKLKGMVILERRGTNNNSGAEVCVGTNCVTTGDDGAYNLSNLSEKGTVTVTRDSYLASAYTYTAADDGGRLMSRRSKGTAQEDTITLPNVTLLGGDIDQKGQIYIDDAILIGEARNSTDEDGNWNALADITNDGRVNLLDMVAVQVNWDKKEPGPWDEKAPAALGEAPAVLTPSDEDAVTQVAVSPANAAIDEPNGSVEVAIAVEDVTDLYGFTAILTFDPNKVQVVDANENEGGVQIQVGDLLDPANQFVIRNEVNNQSGRIELSITQTAPAQPKSGSGTVGTVTFQAVGTGEATVELASIQLRGNSSAESQEISVRLQNGTLQLPSGESVMVYLPLIVR